MKKLDPALEFFDKLPLGTPEEERARAVAWAETALQHHRNEKSWEERAVIAEAALHTLEKHVAHAMGTEWVRKAQDAADDAATEFLTKVNDLVGEKK